MNQEIFSRLYKDVMQLLGDHLPPNLFYHCPGHTTDVIEAAERLAKAEHCTENEILLIKTAALFHDTGYLRDMREHEKHGCDIAVEMLSDKISREETDVICGLIMATKVPQVPHNKLEQIICDADLDYLGRDDYFTIAENLYREFMAFEKIRNEKDWTQMQLSFLQSHRYFTKTAIETRQQKAAMNLQKIREAVAG